MCARAGVLIVARVICTRDVGNRANAVVLQEASMSWKYINDPGEAEYPDYSWTLPFIFWSYAGLALAGQSVVSFTTFERESRILFGCFLVKNSRRLHMP